MKYFTRLSAAIVVLVLLLTGCEIFFSTKDSGKSGPETAILTQVDLYLVGTGSDTEALVIEIRDDQGTLPALWSFSMDSDQIISGWNEFMVDNLELQEGTTYRIYAYLENHTDGYLVWRSSMHRCADHYAPGQSSVSAGTNDYCFRTYIEGELDQYMDLTEYGFQFSSEPQRFQEFVPGASFDLIPRHFVLEYNQNEATSSSLDSYYYRHEGDIITLPGSEEISRTGYTLTGWTEDPGGTGTLHAPGASFTMPGASVDLYAQWEEE